jgi:hypothetical protein
MTVASIDVLSSLATLDGISTSTIKPTSVIVWTILYGLEKELSTLRSKFT